MLKNLVNAGAVGHLEKQLSLLRERAMDRLLAGDPMTDEEFQAAEDKIVNYINETYFGPDVKKAFEEAGYGEESDPKQESMDLIFGGVLFSHRILAALPVVGAEAPQAQNGTQS